MPNNRHLTVIGALGLLLATYCTAGTLSILVKPSRHTKAHLTRIDDSSAQFARERAVNALAGANEAEPHASVLLDQDGAVLGNIRELTDAHTRAVLLPATHPVAMVTAVNTRYFTAAVNLVGSVHYWAPEVRVTALPSCCVSSPWHNDDFHKRAATGGNRHL